MSDAAAIFDPATAAGAAGAGFVATIVAQFFRSQIESQKAALEILRGRTEIADASSDKASVRDGDAGKVIRRMIYFGCAFTIIVAPFIFAFFSEIPVQVEQREVCGGWLWGAVPEWTTTVFHKIEGFYLPDSVQEAFITFLIPFYLGRGAAK